MDTPLQTTTLTFSVEVLDADVNSTVLLQAALAEAADDAATAARAERQVEDLALQASVSGSFAGVGEAVVVLVVQYGPQAAGILAAGVLAGIGRKVGEEIFARYIAPRLRQRNLIPSEPQP